jgi:hypothetical protein
MSPLPEDDDPTHALDDFVRRMRQGAAPPDAAPDLTGLGARLHPERPSPAARPRGGTLRSGQTWDADDVEDVPMVDLPRPPAERSDAPSITLPRVDLGAEDAAAARTPEITLPPVLDATPTGNGELDAATRDFNHFAAVQWDAEAEAARGPAWQPDPRALGLRRHADPRLLEAWRPGAWTGAQRLVFDGATELVRSPEGGSPVVEIHPPHRLLLLWPPQRMDAPTLSRWPQQLRLAAVQAADAPAALLADLPQDANLWLLATAQDVDWALAAETVLHHTPGLRPFQIEGLRAFIAAEREASYAQLNADYHQPEAGGPVQRR